MIRLFHVSDLHFGCEDQVALDWFADCVRRERPDAIACTGDLTMRARSREFKAAMEWIQGLGAPVTVEVGNHDLPYYNLVERFFFPYRRIRRIEKLVEREIDLPGLSLIPLKTTARGQWRWNWSRGWVTGAALTKTLRAIADLPDGRIRLITAHHPLLERNKRGELLTTGGERALDALAAAGVDAVLTGHVHDAFDLVEQTPHGPVRMIGAGTLSKRVRSTPPSFNELTVTDGVLNVKVRNLEAIPTPAMQIDEVPPNALPPEPGEAVAPVSQGVPAG